MSNAKPLHQQQYEGKTQSLQRVTATGDGVPVKPKDLTDEGKRFWKIAVQHLINSGVATAQDQSSIEQMTYWWCVWKKSKHLLLEIDDIQTTDSARAMQFVSKASDNYRRYAQQFGLTPQARNSVSPGEVDDDLAEFMGV